MNGTQSTEVLMSYNWNVYKIFKNGKRAKAPLTTFTYEDEGSIYEYFEAEVKKKFSEKIRGSKFTILREDVDQNRTNEEADEMEDERLKKQTLILARFLKNTGVKPGDRVVGGLIFAKATRWTWQWCALECGTNRYVAGLSPRFDYHPEAEEWMNQQIQNLK